jgi:hypothetical protein
MTERQVLSKEFTFMITQGENSYTIKFMQDDIAAEVVVGNKLPEDKEEMYEQILCQLRKAGLLEDGGHCLPCESKPE